MLPKVGCFVSPHGFGHAARVCAILEALHQLGEFEPHIFTSVGRDLFEESLGHFVYHDLVTDVGFIHDDAFQINERKTVSALTNFYPFNQDTIDRLARQCHDFSFLLCDISPLGIAVGKRAGIATVLVENFTWDWLYKQAAPSINRFSRLFEDLFHSVDFRIQTEPLCAATRADMRCGPIFRRVRGDKASLRRELGADHRPLVLITLGGIEFVPQFLQHLESVNRYFFLFTGQQETLLLHDNVLLLGRENTFYHPDLVNAADVVVFKSGYSTLAECYQAGIPSLCIQRQGFAESAVLEKFAREQLNAEILSQEAYCAGRWTEQLPALLSMSGRPPAPVNGADQVAAFLRPLL